MVYIEGSVESFVRDLLRVKDETKKLYIRADVAEV